MKSLLYNPFLALMGRIIVGITFIYASIGKIENPFDFSISVSNYQILPDTLINAFAIVVPWIEFYAGVGLILGFLTTGSALAIAGLLTTFIIAISVNLIRGVDIACGCFTLSDESASLSTNLLLRDIGLLILAVQVLIAHPRWAVDCLFTKKRPTSKRYSL